MKSTSLKQRKISLTDKEYMSLCDEAKSFNMSFIAIQQISKTHHTS